MSLFTIGRLCVKLAGRDAGKKCVVVEEIDNTFVLVDGNVRRKRVNTKHLEPLKETLDLKAKASHEQVKAAFETLGLSVWDKKSKQSTERPRRIRAIKEKVAEAKKEAKVKKEKKTEATSKETPTKGIEATVTKETETEEKPETEKPEETSENQEVTEQQ
ncbi:50S ribosomal protein L14e [Candidatus Woesearchaeota archaeon]|nr:50S ribosomal protein L14e [Candidatus Woesearchaeota archaeon]